MASELPIRPADDTADLRARYNRLCAALTMNAGANAAAAERVLQELQALAQKIAFRESECDPASQPSLAPRPTPAAAKSNVIAFRCRVKAGARENPRLSAALSALTDDVPLLHGERGEPSLPEPAATPGLSTPASAAGTPVVAAVAKQGAELERLARKTEDQSRVLERLEQQLHQDEAASDLSAEVAQLRSAAARQGEQLVSLATAVHRLAKLIAAHAPDDRR
jgi:hypothetical protein